MMEAGFRRGWADAVDGHESSARRFCGDFSAGYQDGYKLGQVAVVDGKTVDQSLSEWSR